MITLDQWDTRYRQLKTAGLVETWYGGPLSRHVRDGDYRLGKLRFDDSPAALRLWNFLLTEEMRLNEARAKGTKIVGTMKDLGTVPVMAYAMDDVIAFYPDGAWWVPCIMEQTTRDCSTADAMGIDESFCPVRAMLGAFVNCEHFPRPDLLCCSVGATCDDFSAIAQRLEATGREILWWEMPARRTAEEDEEAVLLPGGFVAPMAQVKYVEAELGRVRIALEAMAGTKLTDEMLHTGIAAANEVRGVLRELRRLVFTSAACPLPALELLIAEMLAIHYCSDRRQTLEVLRELLNEVKRRVSAGVATLPQDAARIFWVNPVADLQAMNLLETSGGRLCGTEFLFCHALDAIPTDMPPMLALAQMALGDPMVGASRDRAERICRDAREFGAEAVVVSRIPGASHCAWEGSAIMRSVQETLGIPAIEIEVPPIDDALRTALGTRLEALVGDRKVPEKLMICAGIDAGSRAVKIVLLDRSTQQVIASGIADQTIDHDASAMSLLQRLLKMRGLERKQITRTVATGYARGRIRLADTTITEITCHAVGVRRQCPGAMTILEIGGQDSKLIRLDTGGNVRDFAMNDRCAAGTGRFLEIVAERLETKLESLGQLAAGSRSPATISSTCVVFAETEIIGLLASGVAREDIVAGIQHAMASRMAAMAGSELTEPVVFTGGVALTPGMKDAMALVLEHEVSVAPEPQMTGALGAALLAAKGR